NLRPGEELFYDYALQVDEPITREVTEESGCFCGSSRCRGTMLEQKTDLIRNSCPSSFLILNSPFDLFSPLPALSASGGQPCSRTLPRPCDQFARIDVLSPCYLVSTSRRRHSPLGILRSLFRKAQYP